MSQQGNNLDGSPTGRDMLCTVVKNYGSGFFFSGTGMWNPYNLFSRAAALMPSAADAMLHAISAPLYDTMANPERIKATRILEGSEEKAELIRLFEKKQWDRLPPEMIWNLS